MRLLQANEIQAKVKAVYNSSVMLLIYKDARVDMSILDETYGAENWACSYREVKGNLFCTISVWDKEKNMWVSKEDVGVESMTEGEKGEASDSFKRAGTKWGIGRELYTSPRIFVNLDTSELNGKKVKTSFYVSGIDYANREISYLQISDQYGKVRFTFDKTNKISNKNPKITREEANRITETYDKQIVKEALLEFGYSRMSDITDVKAFEARIQELLKEL